jgi:DNA polymerase-3 subunit delta'
MVKIMAFKDILDQEIVKKILQGALKENRISHAYLFTGPAGVGKWATAIEFAKAVNCLKEGVDSCGDCPACKKISRLAHADLILIFPLPPLSGKRGKKGKEEEEQRNRTKFMEDKLSNPYKMVKFEKPGSISIEEIRSAQKSLLYTPVEGKYKVLMVQEPEKMSREAESCFLKTLEEPPRNSLILFLSSEPDKLMPTIVSRCQRIRFKRIREELIIERLEKALDIDEKKALHYARLSEGSLGVAFSLAEGGKDELRLKGVEFLEIVSKNDRLALVEFVQQMSKDYERELFLEFFSFLSGFLRDMYIMHQTKGEEKLLNPDLQKEIRTAAGYFKHSEEIQKALVLLEKTRENLLRNVNPKLALLNLGFELKNLSLSLRVEKLAT